MGKSELLEMHGQVVEVLPNAMFRVRLDNGHIVLTHISGRMRRHNINVLLHDYVTIEMSPYDLERGRIVFRHRHPPRR